MTNIDIFFEIFKNSTAGKIILSVLTGMVGSAILVVFFFPLLSASGLLKLLPWIVGFNAALTGYTLVEKTGSGLKYRHLCTATAGAFCAATACIVAATAALRTQGVFQVTVSDGAIPLAVGITTAWLGGMLAIKYFGLETKGHSH
jgi:hypothetical protein